MTKGAICNALIERGLLGTFDYALPQDWVNATGQHVLRRYVWHYPEGSIFGEPLDVIELYEKHIGPVQ